MGSKTRGHVCVHACWGSERQGEREGEKEGKRGGGEKLDKEGKERAQEMKISWTHLLAVEGFSGSPILFRAEDTEGLPSFPLSA